MSCLSAVRNQTGACVDVQVIDELMGAVVAKEDEIHGALQGLRDDSTLASMRNLHAR